ncbi:primosomal protein N' family DNA-binding protein, partial [Actinomyces gerencseriae]
MTLRASPDPAGSGHGPAPARTGEIAGVLVDVDLAHLDRPLDYAVPEELSGGAQVGRLVRVTLAGSRANGWIVSRRRGP